MKSSRSASSLACNASRVIATIGYFNVFMNPITVRITDSLSRAQTATGETFSAH
jgi:hypothetical protein